MHRLIPILLLFPFAVSAVAGPAPLAFDDLVLLPVSEERWELLILRHPDLMDAFESIHERRASLQERIEAEGETDWLRAQLVGLDAKENELAVKIWKLVPAKAVDASALARIRRTARGPLRARRFAHRLVLENAGERRALVTRVIHAIDAAQVALLRHGARRAAKAEEGPADEGADEATESALEHVERRFWRLVDVLLPDEAKRKVRRHLPRPFQSWDDPLEQMLFLPGLTLSQAGRLRSLGAEQESEAGPDEVAMLRIERKLKEKGLDDKERESLEQQMRATELRLLKTWMRARTRALALLTAAQRSALLAIPPRVSIDERSQEPEAILERVELSDEQHQRLVVFAARLEKLRAERDSAADKLERDEEDLDPDSPRMQAMEMREMMLTGRMQGRLRQLIGEVFTKLLTPEQVVDWLLR